MVIPGSVVSYMVWGQLENEGQRGEEMILVLFGKTPLGASCSNFKEDLKSVSLGGTCLFLVFCIVL